MRGRRTRSCAVDTGATSRGDTTAPGCVDCHSPHLTVATDTPKWKLQGIQECGTCHEKETLTYRDTFHGKVTSLGFVRVAACADCHGAHEVLPSSDPRSPIAPENLMETCGNCHSNLNENYVRYNPHADHRDREGEPLLYWATVSMHALLIGVFGLFGLHTLLVGLAELAERLCLALRAPVQRQRRQRPGLERRVS